MAAQPFLLAGLLFFSGQRPLTAYTKRPARSAPLPALIVLGGVGTGSSVLDLLEPKSLVVLAAFDYPYDGPKRFSFPRSLLDLGKIKAAVHETPAAINALREKLSAEPYVLDQDVCVVGASFGAPFALRAAAQDPGLDCLVIVQGFADIHGTASHRMRQLWSKNLGFFTRPATWLAARALTFFLNPPIPEQDAPRLRSHQRVLLIEAAGDTQIPQASRALLWTSLQRSGAVVKRVVLPGDHIRPRRSSAQIGEIMEVIADWLR